MGFILRYKAYLNSNLLVIDFTGRLFFMQLEKFFKNMFDKGGRS